MLERMGKSELDNLIRFFRMSSRLKRVPRSGWVEVGVDSPESVADHTFGTAVLCMIFSDLRKMDRLKILEMALLHDISEVITGDLTPTEKTEEALERKDAAVKQLLNLLPRKLQERYRRIWLEYADCKTEEARHVRELEKLEMALQAKEYEKTQPSLKKLKRFIESADKVITLPEVRKILSRILDTDC